MKGHFPHTCHAAGCHNPCPPKHLMCGTCWALVPPDLQTEVYRTVGLRGPEVDHTWAPWWEAQGRAIAAVARITYPDKIDKIDKMLDKELSYAEQLRQL